MNQVLLTSLKLEWLKSKGVHIGQFQVGQQAFLHSDTSFEPPCHVTANMGLFTPVQWGAFSYAWGSQIKGVEVGRYCSIATGVLINADEHPISWMGSTPAQYSDFFKWGALIEAQGLAPAMKSQSFQGSWKKTKIGNDVWIGANVVIKGGLTIGDGAVIGANSVVTKDVAPYCIVGGVPAKVIRSRFPDSLVERLLGTQWWRFALGHLQSVDFSQIAEQIGKLEEVIASGIPEYSPQLIRPADLVDQAT